MLFDTSLYAWFFIIVFFVYWAISKYDKARIIWLLVASLVFYGSWNYKYLWLILFSALVDYFVGRELYKTDKGYKRKLLLVTSLVSNLGLLGIFKYLGFFSNIINDILLFGGTGKSVPLYHIVLPVGISFYTFQTLSYTIDIYRRELEPVNSFTKFLLFVSFFPQLVAGPIVRAKEFLPQIDRRPKLISEDGLKGIFLIAIGITKKVAIANYISVNFVDRIFENPHAYSSAEVLIGIYGYAMQIYCDFSGYTDVAIGSALLLGFTLPENFRQPYTSTNLQEFWRKWHISLSTWLRDYLYISLGGNRKGSVQTYINLMITMILGGLWHGASWNFVIWGTLHGVILALNRWFQRKTENIEYFKAPPRYYIFLSWFLTFNFICFAWIFFRAQDIETVKAIFISISEISFDIPNVTPLIGMAIFVPFILHFIPREKLELVRKEFISLPPVIQAVIFTIVVVLLYRTKGMDVVPFIYFQF